MNPCAGGAVLMLAGLATMAASSVFYSRLYDRHSGHHGSGSS